MKNLTNTKTSENLAKAFAGESQARNRYTFYSKVADKEGHKQIASIFLETADNERAHAKTFFNFLIEGLGTTHINVNADYPIGFENTIKNLQYAAEGEKEEWGSLYPGFADTAKQEGFPEIEVVIKNIVKVEEAHEKRFLDYMNALKNGTLYKKETPVYWKCSNCGFIYYGNEAPQKCPACHHAQGYFEIMYNLKA